MKGIDIAPCHAIKFKGSADQLNVVDGNDYGICVE
jgi:hypothetical protein